MGTSLPPVAGATGDVDHPTSCGSTSNPSRHRFRDAVRVGPGMRDAGRARYDGFRRPSGVAAPHLRAKRAALDSPPCATRRSLRGENRTRSQGERGRRSGGRRRGEEICRLNQTRGRTTNRPKRAPKAGAPVSSREWTSWATCRPRLPTQPMPRRFRRSATAKSDRRGRTLPQPLLEL